MEHPNPINATAWHNIGSGRIFIFGTGPSLLQQKGLLGKMRGEATFACNSLPRWKDCPFTPTYYAVTDIYGEELLRKYSWPELACPKFHIGWDKEVSIPEFLWVEKATDNVQVQSHGFVGFGSELPPIPTGRTSPLTMCQLAAWIGYREFYFLGIEQSDHGYVYDPASELGHSGRGANYNHRYLLAVQRCFARARADIEAAGALVYDCTPGGWLNRTGEAKRGVGHKAVLEYKRLEEVLQ